MLAFGLLDLFWSMLWFFLFVAWISLVIRVFADIFRSDDLGGVSKVVWVLLVIFLPLFGVLMYTIARGGKMTEHAINDAQRRDDAFAAYVQQAAGSAGGSGSADELAKLVALRDQGVLTPDEFAAAKAKALS